MKSFPQLSDSVRMDRLQPPTGRVPIVLDTDTFNEIDDQFAIVHALLSPEQIDVQAIYAAPYYNDRSANAADGMEKSYEEIARLLERLNLSMAGFAHRGSAGFLQSLEAPIESAATRDLIDRAMAATEPLFVVAIGALTNIASAILLEPAIIKKIVVVWLGGNALNWPHTIEFNLAGDVMAARVVFDCGVPLVQIPCAGVTTHLTSTVPEIERYVAGQGAIGDFLAETFKGYSDDHFGWSKEIWDVVAIAYLLDASWMPSQLVASPIIAQANGGDLRDRHPRVWGENPLTWSFDPRRHLIRSIYHIERDPMFRDLFRKLALWAEGKIALPYK